MERHYTGAMKGRTMYVVPFSMGPLGSPIAHIGVQLTDSAYVAVNMRIMTRMGQAVLDVLGADGDFVPCVHSVGYPLTLADGTTRADVAVAVRRRQQVHRPLPRDPRDHELRLRATAATPCSARSASRCASPRRWPADDGWMAEHMLILGVTPPDGEKIYVAAAFPSACGKTNMAMMVPTLPGWKVETIGDDIAWMKFGDDGRLYAINPEAGFFGVAPSTGARHQPQRREVARRELHLHQRRPHRRRRHLVGGPVARRPSTSRTGRATTGRPTSDTPAAHPNARFTAPAAQCPSIAPEWEDPEGVPISAILFGGRRATNVPLVTEAYDWEQGVFLGSIMSSETTAAQAGAVGKLRFDPFAMLPVLRVQHGRLLRPLARDRPQATARDLPKLFLVNWFRKGDDGKFLWPGFGENSRVLKWVVERVAGAGAAQDTRHRPRADRGGPRHHRPGDGRRRAGRAAVGGHPLVAGRGAPARGALRVDRRHPPEDAPRRAAGAREAPGRVGDMAVSAYILIQTEVGKAHQVSSQVAAIDGIVAAEDVTGPYDVIARAEALSVDELGKMVVSRVQMIDGITRTLTCPVVHL